MTFLVGRPLTYAITATAGSGFLLFGYDQGVMSGLLTGDAFTARFPEINTTKGGHGSPSLQGTGCFLGAILTLIVGEKLGRRKCIMTGSIVLSIGAALQCSAYSIPHLIVGRIVAGIGNGLNTSAIRKGPSVSYERLEMLIIISAVWHSELSKAASRGKGLAIELAINIFGVMLSYWVGKLIFYLSLLWILNLADYGFSYVESEAQFRFPIALQIVFAIFTFFGVLCLPESPRWLIKHGDESKARHVLWSLQPNARDIDEQNAVVNLDVTEITRAIEEEEEASTNGSFKAIFQNGQQKFLYRTLLGMGGQMMQQVSGINLITYYATEIFEDSVGMGHNTALLLSGFNGVAYFFSSLVPIWVIDRLVVFPRHYYSFRLTLCSLGRRKLMMFAVVGQGCCMAILAGTVWNGGHQAGLVATVMLFLFNFFFACPQNMRLWLFGLVQQPWPLLPTGSSLSWSSRSRLSAFQALDTGLTSTSLPRNLTLEQIDRLFTGEKIKLYWHPSMGTAGDADIRVGQEKDIESEKAQHVE
ncbi:hypothetical protein N7474_001683 [Penicillium riverlandense]|uniref:uncharacterized protein n=1 Tax=Penicillium riverlandense TaxID=1903569 RepID=UPI002546CFC5|nr:uncharacterized protein N7474_001683 [Penicillium riverlandense]KAJ5833372.1 hypothetical protein N7474_001683 [Penicillium riverlandense]